MLKKTLLATSAISATLLAAAAVLPPLAQSSSGAPSTSAAPTAPPLADALTQDKREAADDSPTRTSEHRRDRHDAKETNHGGRRIEATAGVATDAAVPSAYRDDKRGDERRGTGGEVQGRSHD